MDEPILPPRPRDGHKGTFGTVLVVGGHAGGERVMVGGPALAALGALRVGAGRAVLAAPAPLVGTALAIAPSATAVALPVDDRAEILPAATAAILDRALPDADAVALGPGLGTGDPQRQVVARLLAMEGPPMVVDADALNALAALDPPQDALRVPAVLTPHPGEWRRLATALRIDGDPVDDSRRPDAATALAQRLGAVVVLKGAKTVVADGLRTWTSPHANPALATGGSGDVLAGAIAGAIAQWSRHRSRPPVVTGLDAGRSDEARMELFDAARLGVLLHAEAAALWSATHGDAGMLATDLAAAIPDAMRARRAESAVD